jgi:hypothetical protein
MHNQINREWLLVYITPYNNKEPSLNLSSKQLPWGTPASFSPHDLHPKDFYINNNKNDKGYTGV